jgi:hypothetical protein
MVFSSAAGHTNLPQGNWVPTIFSKKVLKFFRRASVAEDITNTDYFGEIANQGDTVRIIKEPTITISDYFRGTKVIPQDLDDTEDTLTVDQGKYFAFKVDDIEVKQSHINWEALATGSAAYALKDAYDTAILLYISGQVPSAADYGTTGAPIDVGYAAGEVSPLNVLTRLSRLLDDNDVPEENRWFVAKPIFWEVMADENSKLMGVDFTGDANSKLRNGRVTDGLIRGFRCYKSNNTPIDTVEVGLAGHMSSTATASQIAKTEMIRDNDSFADIVRGLHVYGRKTLRTEALTRVLYSID